MELWLKTDATNVDGLLKRAVFNQSNGCYEWTGATRGPGGRFRYGIFFVHRKPYSAHRRVFQLANPLVDISKLFICHSCDNPICINPRHLFAGTQSDNIKDCVAKGRHAGISTKGSLKKTSKLKESQIPTIRREIQSGEACTAIARRYGVSHSVIYGIKHRKYWSHVP